MKIIDDPEYTPEQRAYVSRYAVARRITTGQWYGLALILFLLYYATAVFGLHAFRLGSVPQPLYRLAVAAMVAFAVCQFICFVGCYVDVYWMRWAIAPHVLRTRTLHQWLSREVIPPRAGRHPIPKFLLRLGYLTLVLTLVMDGWAFWPIAIGSLVIAASLLKYTEVKEANRMIRDLTAEQIAVMTAIDRDGLTIGRVV